MRRDDPGAPRGFGIVGADGVPSGHALHKEFSHV